MDHNEIELQADLSRLERNATHCMDLIAREMPNFAIGDGTTNILALMEALVETNPQDVAALAALMVARGTAIMQAIEAASESE